MSGYSTFTSTDVLVLRDNCFQMCVYEISDLPLYYGFTYNEEEKDSITPEILDLNVCIYKGRTSHKCTIESDKTIMKGNGNLIHIQEKKCTNMFGLYWLNNAVEAKLGRVGYEMHNEDTNRTEFYINEVNYHPFSAQTFVPECKSLDYYYIVLAEPYQSDISDVENHLKVFRIPGKQSLYIHPGVWHCPPIVFNQSTHETVTMKTSQSREHSCVVFNILERCGRLACFNVS